MEQEEKKDNPDNEDNKQANVNSWTQNPMQTMADRRKQDGKPHKRGDWMPAMDAVLYTVLVAVFNFHFLQRWNMGNSYAFRI